MRTINEFMAGQELPMEWRVPLEPVLAARDAEHEAEKAGLREAGAMAALQRDEVKEQLRSVSAKIVAIYRDCDNGTMPGGVHEAALKVARGMDKIYRIVRESVTPVAPSAQELETIAVPVPQEWRDEPSWEGEG